MTDKEYNNCVSTYSDDIYRFAVYLGIDKDYANDIVQDTFLSLWKSHAEIEADKAKAYLLATAHNLVNSNFRHKDVEKRYTNDLQMETTTHIDRAFEAHDQLYKTMDAIPAIQKSALVLKDIEGYSYKEIGKMLDLTIQQVEVYIFRARVALKKELLKQR